MRFRGGEFSTGTMGNFQPELTRFLSLLDANGLTTLQSRLSSEVLTASPRGEQNAFMSGTLSSTWTASSWTPDKALT
jgi:hypothetical protein